jgi:hypothetical protein
VGKVRRIRWTVRVKKAGDDRTPVVKASRSEASRVWR